ncbi:MAG TPA: flagellar protein FlaG [Ruminiclostridium sp.]
MSTNISVDNSSKEYAVNSVKKSGSTETAKTFQSDTRSISQLNDYDMNVMPVSERIVIEAIQKANKAISGGDKRFEFSIHEKTNEIVVKIFDSNTNELISEIPNEKILDMVANFCEMSGIFVDEKR